MPRLIDPGHGPAITLPEAVEALYAADIDFRDEDAFASLGPLLARLGRDRAFLGDLAIAELRARCAGQVRDNGYGPQVILLHAGTGDWFIRANIWPAADDSMVKASGRAPFFYDVPHDHNFSFLTVGYFGPGYDSDYWEYDHAAVDGHVGEPVALTPCGRQRLDPGKVMLYRAHRDVHDQLPPASLSVSLNIMESTRRQRWLDQYRFDMGSGTIAGLLNPLATAALLPLAARLGGEGGAELLARLARTHPSDRLRFAALAAAASAAPDIDRRLALLATGTAAPTAYVRAMSRARIALIERHRGWIEGDASGSDGIGEHPDDIAA